MENLGKMRKAEFEIRNVCHFHSEFLISNSELFCHQTHFLAHLAQGLFGYVRGALGTVAAHGLQIGLVLDDALGFLADRAQGLDDGLAHGGLKTP